jgi:glycerol dehydrogenase
MLTDAPSDEVATVFSFCEAVGLPIRLVDIGLGNDDRQYLLRAAEKACKPDQPIHHEAGVITPVKVLDAMLAADALGQERKGSGEAPSNRA